VQTYFLVGIIALTAACLRYLLMTGTYYAVVCQVFDRKFRKYKINQARASGTVVKSEMTWALLNNVNYAILAAATYGLYELGLLKLYFDWEAYGTIYGLLMIPALLLAHDTYFFWVHYLMHRRPFWRLSHHSVHHQFHNVTPWSAFSVHPIEGFIELLFRPVLLMAIPGQSHEIQTDVSTSSRYCGLRAARFRFARTLRSVLRSWFSRFRAILRNNVKTRAE